MKRLLSVLVILGLVFGLCAQAHAVKATTVTKTDITNAQRGMKRVVLTITWTADDGSPDAAVTSASLDPGTYGIKGWYWYQTETDPGSTAPTAAYDIAVTDEAGVDVSGGLLANRSATDSERVNMGIQANGFPVIRNTWTWALTNNTDANATGTCTLTFVED